MGVTIDDCYSESVQGNACFRVLRLNGAVINHTHSFPYVSSCVAKCKFAIELVKRRDGITINFISNEKIKPDAKWIQSFHCRKAFKFISSSTVADVRRCFDQCILLPSSLGHISFFGSDSFQTAFELSASGIKNNEIWITMLICRQCWIFFMDDHNVFSSIEEIIFKCHGAHSHDWTRFVVTESGHYHYDFSIHPCRCVNISWHSWICVGSSHSYIFPVSV